MRRRCSRSERRYHSIPPADSGVIQLMFTPIFTMASSNADAPRSHVLENAELAEERNPLERPQYRALGGDDPFLFGHFALQPGDVILLLQDDAQPLLVIL